MKRKLVTLTLVAFSAAGLFGQDEAEEAATQAFDSFASGIEKIVEGMSIESSKYEAAGIVNVSNENVVGVQFGLGVNVVKGDMRGVQMAVGGNFSDAMPVGAQLASLINVTGEVGYGVQFAGVINAVSGTAGSQFAGAVNLAGVDSKVQAAGAVNITGRSSLLQMAGAVNIAGESVRLAQMAGAVNLAPGRVGSQFAGAVNIADGPVGAQFAGVVNISTGKTGLQVGLINIAAESVLLPIGLINVVSGIPWRVSFKSDDQGRGQVSLKTGNKYFYTLLGVTAPELSEDRPNFRSGFGVTLPLGRFLYLESDYLRVNSSGTTINDQLDVWVKHGEDQFRIQAGIRFLPFLGISGGISYTAKNLVQQWQIMPVQTTYQVGLELYLTPPKMGNLGLDQLW